MCLVGGGSQDFSLTDLPTGPRRLLTRPTSPTALHCRLCHTSGTPPWGLFLNSLAWGVFKNPDAYIDEMEPLEIGA